MTWSTPCQSLEERVLACLRGDEQPVRHVFSCDRRCGRVRGGCFSFRERRRDSAAPSAQFGAFESCGREVAVHFTECQPNRNPINCEVGLDDPEFNRVVGPALLELALQEIAMPSSAAAIHDSGGRTETVLLESLAELGHKPNQSPQAALHLFLVPSPFFFLSPGHYRSIDFTAQSTVIELPCEGSELVLPGGPWIGGGCGIPVA